MLICEAKGCSKNNWQNQVIFDFVKGFYFCEDHHSGFSQTSNLTWQRYGHPTKPWLTNADVSLMKNRVISKDDNRTVVDSITGHRTELIYKHK